MSLSNRLVSPEAPMGGSRALGTITHLPLPHLSAMISGSLFLWISWRRIQFPIFFLLLFSWLGSPPIKFLLVVGNKLTVLNLKFSRNMDIVHLFSFSLLSYIPIVCIHVYICIYIHSRKFVPSSALAIQHLYFVDNLKLFALYFLVRYCLCLQCVCLCWCSLRRRMLDIVV